MSEFDMLGSMDVFFVQLPKTHEFIIELKKHSKKFDSEIALPILPALVADSDCVDDSFEAEISCKNEINKDKSIHTHKRKSQITRQMIVAGLLYVFAYDRENLHFEYYKTLFLEIKPNAMKELLSVAIFQTKNFEFDQALSLLLSLEGLFPDEPIVVLNRALFYEAKADFYRQSELIMDANDNEFLAESYYDAVIAMEPPFPDAFFYFGLFLIKQKNYAKARNFLNSYVSLETKKTPETKQKKEKALSHIASINAEKLDDLAYIDAIDFIKNNEDEKALSRIRDFLSEHPKSWHAWFVLGWALRKLERYEDAKNAFTTALKNADEQKMTDIEDAYSDICNELSICYLNLKDFESAKQWLMSALEFDCENIKLISNLGMVYYKEGNLETAKGFFDTVTVLSPDDKTALYMLEKISNENNK